MEGKDTNRTIRRTEGNLMIESIRKYLKKIVLSLFFDILKCMPNFNAARRLFLVISRHVRNKTDASPPTALLQRGKTLPTSVRDITLKSLMVRL